MGDIEIVGMQEVSEWMFLLLFTAASLKLITLFGGDRASCCDEAIVIKNDGGQIVALATIAPNGEQMSGKPTIVGLYVMPEFRRQGLGRKVLEAAIHRCIDRELIPIRIDLMSEGIKSLVEQLSEDIRQQLNAHDMGAMLDVFPG